MKGWHFQVDTFICEIDASNVVTHVLISVKSAIRIIQNKLCVKSAIHIIQNKLCTLDQKQFLRDLNDDKR
jgi:hypothetical protein